MSIVVLVALALIACIAVVVAMFDDG